MRLFLSLTLSVFFLSSASPARAQSSLCRCLKNEIVSGTLQNFLNTMSQAAVTNHKAVRTCIRAGNAVNNCISGWVGEPEKISSEGRLIRNTTRESWDIGDLDSCLRDRNYLDAKAMSAGTKKVTTSIKFAEFLLSSIAVEALGVESAVSSLISNLNKVSSEGRHALELMSKVGFNTTHGYEAYHAVHGDTEETMRILSHTLVNKNNLYCLRYIQDTTVVSPAGVSEKDLDGFGLKFY